MPVGLPHHDHLFISEREMSRHPYYAFLARWGFRYYGGGAILRDGPVIGNASFQRSAREGPCTEADVALMKAILPHLGRSVEIGVRLQSLERRCTAAETLLDHARYGAALLSETGQVLFLNREARRIAASGEGMSAGGSGLRALRADDDAALQRLIGSALSVAAGGAIAGGGKTTVRKRGGAKRYLVTVSPLPRNGSAFLTRYPAALALIVDPDARPPASPGPLRELFGLSSAEIEVAAALLAGRTVEQIAAGRGVSERTVRAQLESIFRKTGTSRQAGLVALLLGLGSGD
jgi:DNA-binding CsgD family transcriptional regulator